MADSALHFHADDFELSIVSKSRRKCLESFRNGVELRAALAADGNGDLFIWKNGDRPILTVLGQEFHWEFASLRKTQVGDA